MLTSCAGFHASTSIQGPTLINNTFLNSGDDGIAIHGRYYLVVAVGPSHMSAMHAEQGVCAPSAIYAAVKVYVPRNTLHAVTTGEVCTRGVLPEPGYRSKWLALCLACSRLAMSLWQVDKAGGNITVATGCAYPCDRVYQGLGLTGYTNATRKPLTSPAFPASRFTKCVSVHMSIDSALGPRCIRAEPHRMLEGQ